jgi:hypothetical protein
MNGNIITLTIRSQKVTNFRQLVVMRGKAFVDGELCNFVSLFSCELRAMALLL